MAGILINKILIWVLSPILKAYEDHQFVFFKALSKIKTY